MTRLQTTVVIVLIATTTALFTLVERYEPAGVELIRDPSLQLGTAEWSARNDQGKSTIASGLAILENYVNAGEVSISQTLEVPSDRRLLLRLEADIATESVAQGRSPRHAARLLLINRDEYGRRVADHEHVAARLNGTNEWRRYSNVFTIAEEAVELVVSSQLNHVKGQMSIRAISLMPVEERLTFRVPSYGLIAGWCMTLLWIASTVIRRLTTTFHSLVVGYALILAGSLLMTGSLKSRLLEAVGRRVEAVASALSIGLPSFIDAQDGLLQQHWSNVLDNVGHVGTFAVLAILLFLVLPGVGLAVHIGRLVLLATTAEVLQFFVDGRQPEMADWLLDMSGATVALALMHVMSRIRRCER